MYDSTLTEKAEEFRRLHHTGQVLVLPNAWDAASARIYELAGFPAVASTSAGVAFTYGYPDGQSISMEEMLDAISRMTRTVEIPVSADIESGYQSIEETVEAVIDAGAIGINLEDCTDETEQGLFSIEDQVRRIKLPRQTAEGVGVPLVINARTDIYLAGIGAPEDRFEMTRERLEAYAAAGADCLFVPGVSEEPTIQALVGAAALPLNVLAVAATPPVKRLQELNVARVSMGSGPARAALTVAHRVAEELKSQGTFSQFTAGVMPYQDVNDLFRL
jgi:2-methylisocitrate lyase-like PEP mutase family enzyme